MRSYRLPVGLAIFAIALAILVLVWDGNWFKPLVEARASAALGRKVTLVRFDLHLFSDRAVILDGVNVANPDGMPQGAPMFTANRITVRYRFAPLLHGQVVVPEIVLERPHGTLERLASGKANWRIDKTGDIGEGDTKIGALTIVDGQFHYIDPKLRADLMLAVHTEPATKDGESRIVGDIKGTYAAQPVTAHFTGGALLALRAPLRPYPVDFTGANGATHVTLKGTVQNPMALGGANIDLTLAGADLADLFPLTAIPLPSTPAYQLTGKLDYADHKVRFKNFKGTVGNSDLEGTLSEDPGKDRPLITADLTSDKVVLADLAGFIGSTPGKADTQADTHKTQRARQEADPKLIPDTPINLPKLRAADFKVTYKGKRIESQSTPLDNVEANIEITDGMMTLRPLRFGVGSGEISANLALNAQKDLVHAAGDIDFRRIDVQRIVEKTSPFKGVGTIGGRANIDGTGNSLAGILSSGNGELLLFMKGGNVSAILVDLAGLDFGSALISALGIPDRSDVRCMVTSFGLESGVLNTRLFVIDLSDANITGKGTIDLRGNESVDYQIISEPKHFSVGSLHGPIDIRGALKSPSIMPDPANVALRGGAAAVLGALLTPLGALLPTINLGLGEDNNCEELVHNANTDMQRMKNVAAPNLSPASKNRPKPPEHP